MSSNLLSSYWSFDFAFVLYFVNRECNSCLLVRLLNVWQCLQNASRGNQDYACRLCWLGVICDHVSESSEWKASYTTFTHHCINNGLNLLCLNCYVVQQVSMHMWCFVILPLCIDWLTYSIDWFTYCLDWLIYYIGCHQDFNFAIAF